MGNCLSPSEEYLTYARGEDPDLQRRTYYDPVPPQSPNYASNASFASIQSDRDMNRLSQLERDLVATTKRLAFLENIRKAVYEINHEADNDSIDSDDENLEYQRKFKAHLNLEAKELKRLANFDLKQFARKSLARRPDPMEKRRKHTQVRVPGVLPGENTRDWNSLFASRLTLIRHFYSWDEIPMNFFVDQQIESTAQRLRSKLHAKLVEKSSILSLDFEAAKLKKKKKRIEVGNEVIEIDLSSSDSDDDFDSYRDSEEEFRKHLKL